MNCLIATIAAMPVITTFSRLSISLCSFPGVCVPEEYREMRSSGPTVSAGSCKWVRN
jgi:hypothetical protein